MDTDKLSKGFLSVLFLILGSIITAVSLKYFDSILKYIFDINKLPPPIWIISIMLILFIIVFIIYIQRIDGKIENTLAKLVKPSCLPLYNQDERLETMTHYINKAKKSICIFSDLKEASETREDEHVNYLNALNKKLKENKYLTFLRIISYPGDKPTHEIQKEILNHPKYKDHFEIINSERSGREALVAEKNGPQGISILLIDDSYIFLNIDIPQLNPEIANVFKGLFFEDTEGNELITRFKDFFAAITNRIVIA